VRAKQTHKRKKVVNCIALMIKQVMCGVMLIKKNKEKPCLGITGLKIALDKSEPVVEVVSSITGDDSTQLYTEESDLYCCQNSQWNVSLRTLKWSNITTEEIRKFLELLIIMGQVRKDNIRD
jgi:hypothetical protein